MELGMATSRFAPGAARGKRRDRLAIFVGFAN
jgi:hypothetical protein